MNKPRKVEVKCFDLNDQGMGLVKIGKETYAVSNLLPSEVALVDVYDDYKYQNVKVSKILKPSSQRQEPNCGIYQKCGSCQLLHLKYDAQIQFKQDYVINAFKEYKINFKINEVIKAEQISEYRNKMQVAFRYRENKIVYGFYEEDTHRIIPMDECLVQSKIQNDIAKYIQTLMTKMKITPYNEDKRSGIIRFALIKEARVTKQILVVIVTNGEIFPGRNEFVKMLKAKFPEITTIVQNINTRQTSIILGDQERVLFGNGFIEDYLCNIKFKISSKTFFQVNPLQTEKLYSKVIEFGNFNGSEVIIDAYCGVGTIGLIASPHVKHVIGVESNKQSIINAVSSMKENKIKNIEFVCDDATEFIEKLAKNNEKIDAVIMDPPRSGSTEKFLNSILKLKPQKVIYVSCEAKTLARDLKLIINDYKISKTAIVDMFVGTYHIETVVLLEKR